MFECDSADTRAGTFLLTSMGAIGFQHFAWAPNTQKEFREHPPPPLPPALCYIWADKGGIFKSCPRVPKLRILILRGWGRCLNVTLQTRSLENVR